MKIYAFVDLHGNKKALESIIKKSKKKDIELIICAGDFTIFGEEQRKILSKLDKIGKPVLVIHGNHEEEDEVKKDCKRYDNCEFIHNRMWKHKDYTFIGWGGGGFSFRDKNFEKRAKSFKKRLKKEDNVVLVTHAPPYGTKIDDIGEHAGSKSIKKFIEQVNPRAIISGHLHECVGEDVIAKKTVVINPGYKGKAIEL